MQELWFSVLAAMTLLTLLIILLLWAANRSAANRSAANHSTANRHLKATWHVLDWADLTAFILRTMFMKEVFLLSNNASR